MRFACLCLSALCALTLPGCGGGSAGRSLAAPSEIFDWREIATASDRTRLRQWRSAWMQGLAKAQEAGHGPKLTQEGILLQPDAALPWQDPPAGDYHCRMLKIGAKSEGLLDYVAYPPFDCRLRVEDGVMSFAKLTGSQRPLGLFLPDTSRRMIFLGTLQLGDEHMSMQYGRDTERDMAALVERVGAERWRLVFPYPHFESTVDVLELVPVGNGP